MSEVTKLVRVLAFLFGLWKGILGTALVAASIYLLLKLSQLADAYRSKIKS
jgi:hypothetical protein